MGALCMAVHVPHEGGRMLIVTGGDDQAVSVAEVELYDKSVKSFDQDSPHGRETGCSDERTSTGKRYGTFGTAIHTLSGAFAAQFSQNLSYVPQRAESGTRILRKLSCGCTETLPACLIACRVVEQ